MFIFSGPQKLFRGVKGRLKVLRRQRANSEAVPPVHSNIPPASASSTPDPIPSRYQINYDPPRASKHIPSETQPPAPSCLSTDILDIEQLSTPTDVPSTVGPSGVSEARSPDLPGTTSPSIRDEIEPFLLSDRSLPHSLDSELVTRIPHPPATIFNALLSVVPHSPEASLSKDLDIQTPVVHCDPRGPEQNTVVRPHFQPLQSPVGTESQESDSPTIAPDRPSLYSYLIDLAIWFDMERALGRDITVKSLPCSFTINGVSYGLVGSGSFGKVYVFEQDGQKGALKIRTFTPNNSWEELNIDNEIRALNLINSTPHNRLLASLSLPEYDHQAWRAKGLSLMATAYHPANLSMASPIFDPSGADHVKKLFRACKTMLYACVTHEIAAGLVHLHRLGIIHKDIKPENILISAAGHCVIADYGACEISLNSTEYGVDVRKAPGECIETPGFTAPETQYYGLGGFTTFDERVDYWSLGMTMYSLITGWRPPNDATSLTHAQMGLDGFSKMYKNMADCPHDIRILVIKLCQIDPKERLHGARVLTEAEHLMKSSGASLEGNTPFTYSLDSGLMWNIEFKFHFVPPPTTPSASAQRSATTRRAFLPISMNGSPSDGPTPHEASAQHSSTSCSTNEPKYPPGILIPPCKISRAPVPSQLSLEPSDSKHSSSADALHKISTHAGRFMVRIVQETSDVGVGRMAVAIIEGRECIVLVESSVP